MCLSMFGYETALEGGCSPRAGMEHPPSSVAPDPLTSSLKCSPIHVHEDTGPNANNHYQPLLGLINFGGINIR